MAKVTYEFDLNEDERELRFFQSAEKMYFALDMIYSLVREKLKHGSEELSGPTERLLDIIKDKASIIHELGE